MIEERTLWLAVRRTVVGTEGRRVGVRLAVETMWAADLGRVFERRQAVADHVAAEVGPAERPDYVHLFDEAGVYPGLFNGFVSGVTETVGEVIKRAIDPDKDITWGAVLSAFGGGFFGGALGTFGPKLPIRRQTIKATEGLTRSLMPIAGRVAGNTNPLSNRVLGLGVKRVGEDILTSGAGEASKGTAGELGMNADASDNQSALQAAQKDAQASVNRNVQLPNFSNLGQPAATTPAGQTPQPQNTPAPQTQGPQAPTTKKQP